MKKIMLFIRENAAALLFFCLLASIIACLVSTAKISKRQMDLEYQFMTLETTFSNSLSNIEDKVEFLANWAMQSPSVTLGDTYINQADNSKSLVNSKGKGGNSAK